MHYLPPEEERRAMEEIKKWMYMDLEDLSFKLREDAPAEIKQKLEKLRKDNERMFY